VLLVRKAAGEMRITILFKSVGENRINELVVTNSLLMRKTLTLAVRTDGCNSVTVVRSTFS
jgi:hypothetical protein